MAQIGQFAVQTWVGRLRAAVRVMGVADTDVGVDGAIVQAGAWKAQPDAIRTAVDFAGSLADAERLCERYRAQLLSPVVSVTDQLGKVWPSVTVLSVVAEPSATVIAGRVRVDATWVLLPDATRPPPLT